MPRPLFLALDGLDGSGKSTQFQLLLAALRADGIPVTAAIDPGGERGSFLPTRPVSTPGRAVFDPSLVRPNPTQLE